MDITNHRLTDPGIEHRHSPKNSGEFAGALPDTILIHYTGGRSMESAVQTLAESKKEVSAHIVVGRDGEIAQLLDFNQKGWHAGKSEYKGRQWLNQYSIGIEIDNPGFLSRAGDVYTTWFDEEVDPRNVVEARHRNPETRNRFWHRFTKQQIETVEQLSEALVAEYGIQYILGHEEVSPGRKQDPGPAFPLDKLRSEILTLDLPKQQGPEEDEFPAAGRVAVGTALNIRARPNAEAEKVANPLNNDQK